MSLWPDKSKKKSCEYKNTTAITTEGTWTLDSLLRAYTQTPLQFLVYAMGYFWWRQHLRRSIPTSSCSCSATTTETRFVSENLFSFPENLYLQLVGLLNSLSHWMETEKYAIFQAVRVTRRPVFSPDFWAYRLFLRCSVFYYFRAVAWKHRLKLKKGILLLKGH